MTDPKQYRQRMGERLRTHRESLGYSLYRVAKEGGISLQNATAVELGETNYTVDSLLGYLAGCGLSIDIAPYAE